MSEQTSRGALRVNPLDEWDLWSPFRLSRLLEPSSGRAPARTRFVPAVDISEDDAKYVITVEVPGAARDDVSLEMHENTLTIRGEKKSEREEQKEQLRYVERTYGSFSRSFSLPANADGGRVTASFANGVLTIEVPKVEEAKPKVISIE